MIVYEFVGIKLRGQGLPAKTTSIDPQQTIMIPRYFYDIKRKTGVITSQQEKASLKACLFFLKNINNIMPEYF